MPHVGTGRARAVGSTTAGSVGPILTGSTTGPATLPERGPGAWATGRELTGSAGARRQHHGAGNASSYVTGREAWVATGRELTGRQHRAARRQPAGIAARRQHHGAGSVGPILTGSTTGRQRFPVTGRERGQPAGSCSAGCRQHHGAGRFRWATGREFDECGTLAAPRGRQVVPRVTGRERGATGWELTGLLLAASATGRELTQI